MTTTLQAHGGGAQPASIDTSGKIAGGVALRVYGFDSAEDAQAAGYICEGGPAMSVALITDAQIASGAWKAEGDPSALVVYTAPANLPVEGGLAVPVYAVNGWGSTPAPSDPIGDALRAAAVAYWKMEESSGTTRIDATGKLHDLSDTNTVPKVAGKVDSAAKILSAENAYLSCASQADLSPVSVLYIAFWFRAYANDNVSLVIKDKIGPSATEYYILFWSNYNVIELQNDNDYVDAPFTFDTNWHFVEACIDVRVGNGTFHIALDHGAFIQQALSAPLSITAQDFVVGAAYGLTGNSDADIDELGIFALVDLPTSDERDYLYNSGAGRALFPAP